MRCNKHNKTIEIDYHEMLAHCAIFSLGTSWCLEKKHKHFSTLRESIVSLNNVLAFTFN